jgi:NAD(P)-dependent dehydrogenase (short-subunit alcohol dehydrogenase family)
VQQRLVEAEQSATDAPTSADEYLSRGKARREAGDLDGALLLLASDAGRYITGQTILVDGGVSIGALRALPKQE